MATKTKTDMRRCVGSKTFGIEPHDAPADDFPVQPSRKDGLGVMCKPHWRQYTSALRKAALARKANADPSPAPVAPRISRGQRRAQAQAAGKVQPARRPPSPGGVRDSSSASSRSGSAATPASGSSKRRSRAPVSHRAAPPSSSSRHHAGPGRESGAFPCPVASMPELTGSAPLRRPVAPTLAHVSISRCRCAYRRRARR